MGRHQSGIWGETSLNYFYRYLPPEGLVLLHNTRVLHMDYFFQMDTLLLTPRFCVILEVKNYSGHLYFDGDYGQLIRTIEDKREVFDCPIQQVKRQVFHLSKTIEQYKFPSIPIESLVVITNPKAHIESSPNHYEALQKVIKSPALTQKIEEFNKKHKKDIYTTKDIKKVARVLKKLNYPYDLDIVNFYKIDQSDLLTGVLCPYCEIKTMNYRRANWRCMICDTVSKNAHVSALKDYALLISTTITNKECKEYLLLTSSSHTYHLLNSLKLPHTGSRKSRYYHLDLLLDDD